MLWIPFRSGWNERKYHTGMVIPLTHLRQNAGPLRCVSSIPGHFRKYQLKLKIQPVWILGLFYLQLHIWPAEVLPFTTIYLHSKSLWLLTYIQSHCDFLLTFKVTVTSYEKSFPVLLIWNCVLDGYWCIYSALVCVCKGLGELCRGQVFVVSIYQHYYCIDVAGVSHG